MSLSWHTNTTPIRTNLKPFINSVLLPPTSTGPPCVPPLGVLAQVHGGSRGAPLFGGFLFVFALRAKTTPLKLPVQPAASGRLVDSKPFALPPPRPNNDLRRPAGEQLKTPALHIGERLTVLWDGGCGELSPFLLLRSAWSCPTPSANVLSRVRLARRLAKPSDCRVRVGRLICKVVGVRYTAPLPFFRLNFCFELILKQRSRQGILTQAKRHKPSSRSRERMKTFSWRSARSHSCSWSLR